MSLNTLEEIASYIVSEGKGILAADESNPFSRRNQSHVAQERSHIFIIEAMRWHNKNKRLIQYIKAL